MVEAVPVRDVVPRYGLGHWPGLWHWTFIGGLGLSALAAAILLAIAYFAGTAPRLPPSAAALEDLQTDRGSWPPIHVQPLGGAGEPAAIEVSAISFRLMPHASDPSEVPPIDLSDLPPPERSPR